MDIADVRLANLEKQAASYRYAKNFCAAAGIDPSYMSQLRSRAKTLGTDLARRIEERLGLARGALDVPPEPTMASSHVAAAIAHAIESLNPALKQALAALVFELAKQQLAPTTPVKPFDITVDDAHASPDSSGDQVPRRAGGR